MGIVIKDLIIPNKSFTFVKDNKNSEILENLSKVNIFVGANNSGKSLLLRSIFSEVDSDPLARHFKINLKFKPSLEQYNELITGIDDLNRKLREILRLEYGGNRLSNFIGGTSLKDILAVVKPITFLRENDETINHLIKLKEYSKAWKQDGKYIKDKNASEYREGLETHLDSVDFEQIGNELYQSFEIYFPNIILEDFLFKFNRVYIPILRGLRPLNYGTLNDQVNNKQLNKEDLQHFYDDIYKKRTDHDYFKLGISKREYKSEELDIFTGLGMYDIVLKYRNHNLTERNLIKEYENYLSEYFFDNLDVELIAKIEDKGVLTVKIGDEKERPIYELGDGIQSIIIMTFPLFLYKNKAKTEPVLVFIEEPENLLHPGLQRKFIETILTREGFENFQMFFTTHSNHFLDILLDYENISLYSLKKSLIGEGIEKKPQFYIENVSDGNNNVLDILGVRNTSVFLSNCTIWVEGITDRYYLKKYFDIYQDYILEKTQEKEFKIMEFREDYHYSFVEYSGGNITHWSFLDDDEIDDDKKINVDRVCGKLFLIADSDNKTSGKKAERNLKLAENLEENFCLLKVKEMENLLSPSILIEVVKDYECKSENDRNSFTVDAFEEKDYTNECLGKFIEETILKGNRNRGGSYQKKNKWGKCVTITDKLLFSKRAINHINSYSDLSSGAKGLCNCIYRFIAKNNGYDLKEYDQLCEELGIPARDSTCKEKEDILDE